ncbi:hypothetical protein [Paenibacillus sp. HGF5]|uniref:hypothetical protein n=1 Tax=Paenibacillus sp. HGF5 TaxID=908341 RepID=UPI0002072A2B|nr:hypothetical protein [Paenibacillus sp. HGF5]EGG36495.1 conserved domain protein [Paenibacillus sp. HGF5]
MKKENQHEKSQKTEMSEALRRIFIEEEDIKIVAEDTGHSIRTLQQRKKEIIDSGILSNYSDITEEANKRKTLREESINRALAILEDLLKKDAH